MQIPKHYIEKLKIEQPQIKPHLKAYWISGDSGRETKPALLVVPSCILCKNKLPFTFFVNNGVVITFLKLQRYLIRYLFVNIVNVFRRSSCGTCMYHE